MQNRWKNYGLWVSLVSLVLSLLVNTDVIDLSQVAKVEEITNYVLNVFITLGILSNPTSGNGFLDKKE